MTNEKIIKIKDIPLMPNVYECFCCEKRSFKPMKPYKSYGIHYLCNECAKEAEKYKDVKQFFEM